MILRGVHVHVSNMKKENTHYGLESSNNSDVSQPDFNGQKIRKNFVQLRDLERKLIFRITIVTLPSLIGTCCLIAFLHAFTYHPNVPLSKSGFSKVSVVTSYVFPWLSIM